MDADEMARSYLLLMRGLLFPCLDGALAEKLQRRSSHPLSQLVSASKDLVREKSTAELGCGSSAIMSIHIAYNVPSARTAWAWGLIITLQERSGHERCQCTRIEYLIHARATYWRSKEPLKTPCSPSEGPRSL